MPRSALMLGASALLLTSAAPPPPPAAAQDGKRAQSRQDRSPVRCRMVRDEGAYRSAPGYAPV
ncbi:hypothetical protein P1X14_21650, partial [Sphingomonas sp. AOB5]|uniref:hypothetical protein n=1 Tax=Sphingomonas sp. AOB5 TaxID=3034017 RepID=UPI0023F77B40